MFVNRIGTFFMYFGVFLILLFIFSIQAGDGGRAAYLLWGLGLFTLGVILWWSGPKTPREPASRFRMFRRSKSDRKDQAGDRGKRQPPAG